MDLKIAAEDNMAKFDRYPLFLAQSAPRTQYFSQVGRNCRVLYRAGAAL